MFRIRAVSVVCLAVLLLVGAAGAAQEQEKITLEVVLTHRDPNVNIVQDYGPISWTQILAEEFQKRYPHIEVVFRQGTVEQVTVMIAAGIGPDIISSAAGDFVNLGRAGAFVDLKPLLERDGIDFMASETYWPPQYSAYTYKGQQFALPQYLGTIAIYYNADMFGYAGIPDPEPSIDRNTMDWEDFAEIARKLTRDADGDGITDVWGFYKRMRTNRIYYWLKAAGAEFYGNEERTVSTLDSPQAVMALEYLQSLRWDSQVMPPAGITPSWAAGEVAMFEDGSWQLVNFLGLDSQGYPKISFGWNVMPMPIGPSGQRATMATIDGYAINKNTKHLEEAYQLLLFLAGYEANAIKAKYLALQPAHRDVVPEYIGLMQELNRDVADVNVHVFTDAGPYAHPQLLYAQQDIANGLLNEAYTRIFDNREPAGPVWSDMVSRLNTVLASTGEMSELEIVTWQGRDWRTRDFGSAGNGSAKAEDGTLTISASGNDIWGTRDGFRYVYHEVSGDFTATVRLDSVPDTDPWSKAGIMLRLFESADSAHVSVLGTLSNGVVMQERPVTGSASQTAGRTSWTSGSPVWLRLERRGNRVSGYMSTDGARWTHLATVTVDNIPETVWIGPAVTSHSVGRLGEATFVNWTLEQ